jgi:hypothetical protein
MQPVTSLCHANLPQILAQILAQKRLQNAGCQIHDPIVGCHWLLKHRVARTSLQAVYLVPI